jgi:hypothetical protein
MDTEPEPKSSSDDAKPAADVKDKFREALERKRGHDADNASDAEGKGGSKIHGQHGPAHTQRTFRRKSGG